MVNDFDPDNIKEGLDLIDDELDAIEDERPENDGDPTDQEIEDVMWANQELWIKVGEISDFVGQAILKAQQIRKNNMVAVPEIENNELRERNTQIRQY